MHENHMYSQGLDIFQCVCNGGDIISSFSYVTARALFSGGWRDRNV